MTGQYFQNWLIGEEIGEGSFGKVYRLSRKEFDHEYEAALKVIDIPNDKKDVSRVRDEGISEENMTSYFYDMVERIVEEFTLMAKLKGNSNIVSYEDHYVEKKVDEFGWRIYIRMELLTPLSTYIKEHGFTERDVIKLGIDICKGLEICSLYNIIHRDIKPENIFISPIGDYKLGDFGIARELEKTSAGLTRAGTKSYMAPEVAKGREYNSTVDIYSLGMVLYRYLNNNRLPLMPPYPQEIRYSDQEYASMLRISGEEIPRPVKGSTGLADIILKSCAYDASDRYHSAKDMRQALEQVMSKQDNNEYVIVVAGKDDNGEQQTDSGYSSIYYADTTVDLKNEATEKPESEHVQSITKKESDNVIDNRQNVLKNNAESIIDKNEDKNVEKRVEKNEDDNENNNRIDNRKRLIFFITGIGLVVTVLSVMLIVGNNNRENKTDTTVVTNVETTDTGDASDTSVTDNDKSADTQTSDKTEEQMNSSESNKTDEQATASESDKTEESLDTAQPVIYIKVPNVIGIKEGKAVESLKAAGLQVESDTKEYSDTVKKGYVISQAPESDTQAEAGSVISLVVSKGIQKVEVPSLTGMSESKATKKLDKLGLKYKLEKEYSSDVAKGYVISQSISADKLVKKGEKIVLTVSKGAKPQQATAKPSNNSSNNISSNNHNNSNSNSSNNNNKKNRPDGLVVDESDGFVVD